MATYYLYEPPATDTPTWYTIPANESLRADSTTDVLKFDSLYGDSFLTIDSTTKVISWL